jgi:hypothetical protein
MSVKAKFKCIAVTPHEEGKSVQFSAVVAYGPNGERLDGNEQWAKATPSGTLNMFISNPEAADQFQPEKDYYLTFEEA